MTQAENPKEWHYQCSLISVDFEKVLAKFGGSNYIQLGWQLPRHHLSLQWLCSLHIVLQHNTCEVLSPSKPYKSMCWWEKPHTAACPRLGLWQPLYQGGSTSNTGKPPRLWNVGWGHKGRDMSCGSTNGFYLVLSCLCSIITGHSYLAGFTGLLTKVCIIHVPCIRSPLCRS